MSHIGLAGLLTVLLICTFCNCDEVDSNQGHKGGEDITVIQKSLLEEQCVKDSKRPKIDNKSELAKLGEECTTRNGEAGIWMYNIAAIMQCWQCCENYHWNNTAGECQPCGPDRYQKQGAYEDCDPKDPVFVDADVTSSPDEKPVENSTQESSQTEGIDVHHEDETRPRDLEIYVCTATYVVVKWCFFCLPYEKIQIRIHDQSDLQERVQIVSDINTSAGNHTLKNLKPDTPYCIEFRGMNESKRGQWSDGVPFRTQKKVTIPGLFKVTDDNGVVTAQWRKKEGEDMYRKQIKYTKKSGIQVPVYIIFAEEFSPPVRFALPSGGEYGISMSFIDRDGIAGPWTGERNINHTFGNCSLHQKNSDNFDGEIEKNCKSPFLGLCIAGNIVLGIIVFGILLRKYCWPVKLDLIHSRNYRQGRVSNSGSP